MALAAALNIMENLEDFQKAPLWIPWIEHGERPERGGDFQKAPLCVPWTEPERGVDGFVVGVVVGGGERTRLLKGSAMGTLDLVVVNERDS